MLPNNARSSVVALLFAATFLPAIEAQTPTLAADRPVVHGATFLDAISPGGWVTIRGANFTTVTRIWAGADFNGNRLPESLEGVSVKINGSAAYIYFVSPTQLNVLAPDDAGSGLVDIEVTTPGGTARTRGRVQPVAPGFFTFEPMNRMYAAVVHPDGTLAGPANLYNGAVTVRPLVRGGRALAFGSGFGGTTPALPAGLIVAGPAPLSAPPAVTLGRRPVTLEFAGRTGSGLDQFNMFLPDVEAGDQPFAAQSGGVSSQPNLYLCIAANAPASLGISRDAVAVAAAVGGGAQSEDVHIASSGEPLGYVTNIEASPQPAWLSVTKGGTTPSPITITANPAGLAPGSYTAVVVVSSCVASNPPRRITVTFTVTGPVTTPALSVNPANLSFTAVAGAQPAAQNLNVTTTGVAQSFTVTQSTTSGGNWLTVSPVTGSTPATLSVAANTTGLAAGSYDGQVRIATTGGTPINVPVRLTVTAPTGGASAPKLPKLTSVSPRFIPAGGIVDMELTGENLDDTYRVDFQWGNGVVVGARQVTSTKVIVRVGLTQSALPGYRNVSVSTPAGDSNAVQYVVVPASGNPPAADGPKPATITDVAVSSSANAGSATQSVRLRFTDPDGDIRWNEPANLVSGLFVMPLSPNNRGCSDFFGGNVFERPDQKSGQIVISNTFTYVTELRNVNLAVFLLDSKFNVSNVVVVNVPFYHTDCDLRPQANRSPSISNVQASSVANRNQATQQASLDFTDPNGDIRAAGFTRLIIVPRVGGNVFNCGDVWRGTFLDKPGLTSGRISLSETFNYVTELRGGVPLEVILVDAEGNPSPPVSVTVPNWHTLCDITGGFKPSGTDGPKVIEATPGPDLSRFLPESQRRYRRTDIR
ncbi:MAG: IPT/TIG domain-containing protein [Bryobacteraceae bacterium]